MTATSHAIVGTVIAAKIGNPTFAIPIALLSHLILDSIPHWDTATNMVSKGTKKTFIQTCFDFVISIVSAYSLTIFVFPATPLPYTLLIVFFSQLFDYFTIPYRFFRINFPFIYVYKFQKLFDKKLDKPWGIITQIAIVLALLLIAIII